MKIISLFYFTSFFPKNKLKSIFNCLKSTQLALLLLGLSHTLVLAQTAELISTFQGHTDSVKSVAISADGQQALSGSSDKNLKLWNLKTGEEIRTLTGHTDKVYAVVFFSDSKTALSGSGDNTIKQWNLLEGAAIRTFAGHTAPVRTVALAPDEETFLSGSEDKTLKLWNRHDKKELLTFEGHTKPIYAVAFSPDGHYALSGSLDTTLKLWEIETGQEIRTFENHRDGVHAVAFSPDGKMAISGSADSNILLWDIQTGEKLENFRGHKGTVHSVTFSPDGQNILSGSQDNTIKLWFLENTNALNTFKEHTDWVYAVTFLEDGRYALSGSKDKTLKYWQMFLSTTAAFTFSPSSGSPPITITLDASASISNHEIVNYKWATSHGQTLTGKIVDLTFQQGGTYSITLTIKDSNNQTATLTKEIVLNQPPKAAFTVSPTQGFAPLTVKLNASSATDPDGSIESYHWASDDGQTATGPKAEFTFPQDGNYIITLTVKDNQEVMTSAQKTISVNQNTPPIATFTVSPTEGPKPLTLHLDATQSNDPDGKIVSWVWESSSGKKLEAEKTNFVLNTAGKQIITLTVTDNEGGSTIAEKKVTVLSETPIANFQATPLTGSPPLIVQLDGSNSYDPDGRITDYTWTSSDGQQAKGSTAEVRFTKAGRYKITLVVTDDDGVTSDKVTQTILVEDTITVTEFAQLAYQGLKERYQIGEIVNIRLQKSLPNKPLEKVDLWLAIQIPTGELLFLTAATPQLSFSLEPEPFQTANENSEIIILENIEIMSGMEGAYIFYALYVQENQNPMEYLDNLETIQRSNLLIQSTIITNE